VADPNVNLSTGPNTTTSFLTNSPDSYYGNTTFPGTGTVSYTFNATAGNTFVGTATIQQVALIVSSNPGGGDPVTTPVSTSNITGTVSLDGGPPTTFYTYGPILTPGFTVNTSDYTPSAPFNVAGASSFTITYTLSNLDPGSDPTWVRVFYGGDNSGNNPGDPVIVTGITTTVPEPASLSLVGFAALGLLQRRRNRTAPAN
jgi:hypothetical protein